MLKLQHVVPRICRLLRGVGPLAIALASPLTPVRAQTPPTAADDRGGTGIERPTLVVRPAAGRIEIDGQLNDPGWEGAARTEQFFETFPVERGRPEVATEVWIAFDESNLFLAFVAHDDPGLVRTSIRDRDAMWEDDHVGVLLDTYGDASWAYYIFANPAGVQGDSRFSTAWGEDEAFDLVYRSEARRTAYGYQVEMAVPFASLRFPSRDEQTWRATFWRVRPRDSRATYSWAPIDRDNPCFLCQWGVLTGIRGVEPGGAIELLPSVIGSRSSTLAEPDDPGSGLEGSGVEADLSLGVRYAHPSGLTVEATANPDFSQIESDVGQIDVNETFALFFPERRPFFQEGSELFDTFFDVVYTRQINDPDIAAKAIWRTGGATLAYLGARDARSPILLPFQERSFVGETGPSVSNLLRYRQSYAEGSYFGALATDRRIEDGGSGTVIGVDGVHRFLEKYRLEYQLVGSRTAEPEDAGPSVELGETTFDAGAHTSIFDGERYPGFGQYTSLERQARFWSFDFDYWGSSPTLRTDDGFESRNDFRRASTFQELTWYPSLSWIDRFTADVYAERRWTYDGTRKRDLVEPTLEFTLTGQTFVEVGRSWQRERFAGLDFGGMRDWFVYAETTFGEPVAASVFFRRGRDIARNEDPAVLGEATELELAATFKLGERWSIEPSLDFSRLVSIADREEIFSGSIFRTRAVFNFSRRLFVRLVVQYDGFDEQLDVEPLVTYRVNPFTLFFVGSTQAFERFDEPAEFTETSRQIFAKFQVLIHR